jgi:hypothetical protein
MYNFILYVVIFVETTSIVVFSAKDQVSVRCINVSHVMEGYVLPSGVTKQKLILAKVMRLPADIRTDCTITQ